MLFRSAFPNAQVGYHIIGGMTDEDYMRMAIDEARRAERLGEVPIGAVVVYEPIDPATRRSLEKPQVIARACNLRETTKDPAGHAEFLAMKRAAEVLDAWRLTDCTVYVTLEPCVMCAGLMHQARVRRCVYGAADPKAGALGTLYAVNEDKRLNHTFEAVPGVLGDECARMLRDFFSRKRAKRSQKQEAKDMANESGGPSVPGLSETASTTLSRSSTAATSASSAAVSTPAPSAAGAPSEGSGAGDPCAVDLLDVARVAQQVETERFRGPGSVRVVAPAKVNLFLDIGEVRPDGYHEAVSIMHALLLHDVLHLRLAPAREAGLSVDLTCRSRGGVAPLDVAPEDNIVTKAVRQFAQALERNVDETVAVHVEKRIPAQAGLGGGSSDAVAALVGVARLWGVSEDDPRIEEVARSLGADVPFFLRGGCACFTGVGDVFSHELAPSNACVALIKPEGGVSTSAAYRAFDACPQRIAPADRRAALDARHAADVPLRNNLTVASEQLLPVLAEVRAWASGHADVQAALMSGSGSAVFAVCPSFDAAARVAAQAQARGWWARATMFAPVRAAMVGAR